MDIAYLVSELENIAQESTRMGADVEELHMQADELLLHYINNNDVTTAFNNIRKWYAWRNSQQKKIVTM